MHSQLIIPVATHYIHLLHSMLGGKIVVVNNALSIDGVRTNARSLRGKGRAVYKGGVFTFSVEVEYHGCC